MNIITDILKRLKSRNKKEMPDRRTRRSAWHSTWYQCRKEKGTRAERRRMFRESWKNFVVNQ